MQEVIRNLPICLYHKKDRLSSLREVYGLIDEPCVYEAILLNE